MKLKDLLDVLDKTRQIVIQSDFNASVIFDSENTKRFGVSISDLLNYDVSYLFFDEEKLDGYRIIIKNWDAQMSMIQR